MAGVAHLPDTSGQAGVQEGRGLDPADEVDQDLRVVRVRVAVVVEVLGKRSAGGLADAVTSSTSNNVRSEPGKIAVLSNGCIVE